MSVEAPGEKASRVTDTAGFTFSAGPIKTFSACDQLYFFISFFISVRPSVLVYVTVSLLYTTCLTV